jgi:LPXTG-motif cell wall-anchored protein
MKKAIFAFALATLAGLGLYASPAQATETDELPKPTVSIQDGCNDTTVTVTNKFDKIGITVRVGAGDPVEIPGASEKTITVSTVDPIKVEMKVRRSWVTLAEHTWKRPAVCDPHVNPVYECDGDWSLTFVNPKSLDAAKARFVLELDPIVENVKLVWQVKPGMTETLDGLTKGIKARVKVAKGEWTEYTWVKPEKGCEATPAPSTPAPTPTTPAPGTAGGNNGGDLPLTGVGVSGLAAGGLVTVGLGVGLVALRRRRNTFTA